MAQIMTKLLDASTVKEQEFQGFEDVVVESSPTPPTEEQTTEALERIKLGEFNGILQHN